MIKFNINSYNSFTLQNYVFDTINKDFNFELNFSQNSIIKENFRSQQANDFEINIDINNDVDNQDTNSNIDEHCDFTQKTQRYYLSQGLLQKEKESCESIIYDKINSFNQANVNIYNLLEEIFLSYMDQPENVSLLENKYSGSKKIKLKKLRIARTFHNFLSFCNENSSVVDMHQLRPFKELNITYRRN